MSTAPSAPVPQRTVRSRRVYYMSGFDPRGAAFYHRLYREEAVKQALHSGARIEVGPRFRRAPHLSAWTIDADWNGEAVKTEYQFLGWDDIVRRHWEPNIVKLLHTSLSGYAGYIACGAFGRLRQTFRGPLFSALYPFFYLIALVLGAMLCASGAAWWSARFTGLASTAWIAGIAVPGVLLLAGRQLANRFGIFWLMRTYLFVYCWGTRRIAELDGRIDEFSSQIMHDQIETPCDEVLLVGHSVGSLVAVSVAASLVGKMPASGRLNMTLVTLGHCIPLLSLIPSAAHFHRDLRVLAQERELPWLDMAARADALCFSQANPLDISGIDGISAGRPIAQVVRPFRMFDKKKYACIRNNKLRLHFQYLMASDLPDEYDYFRMTAGPARLQPY